MTSSAKLNRHRSLNILQLPHVELCLVVTIAFFILAQMAGTAMLVSAIFSINLFVFLFKLPKWKSLPMLLSLAMNFQIFIVAPVLRVITWNNLEYNFPNPVETFALCGVLSCATLILPDILSARRSLVLTKPLDGPALDRVALICLLVGTVCLVLNYKFAVTVRGSTAQTLGFFFKYIALVTVPAIVFFYKTKDERSSVIIALFVISVMEVGLAAMLMNVRKLPMDFIIAILLGYVGRRGRVNPRFLVTFILVGAIFGTFGSNLINLMRFDIRAVAPDQRLSYLVDSLPRYFDMTVRGVQLDRNTLDALSAKYLDYVGRNYWAQRLSGHQITSVVLNASGGGSFCPADPLTFGFNRIIPAVFDVDKQPYSYGDLFSWQINLRDGYVIGNPFMPLYPSMIGCYGPVGALVVATIAFCAVAALISLVRTSVTGSIWPALIFVILYNPIAEGELAKYIEMFFRIIPEYVSVLLILDALARSIRTRDDRGGKRWLRPEASKNIDADISGGGV